jgi:hypothetical protein
MGCGSPFCQLACRFRIEGYHDTVYPSDLHRLVWLRLLAEHATLRLALRSTDAG